METPVSQGREFSWQIQPCHRQQVLVKGSALSDGKMQDLSGCIGHKFHHVVLEPLEAGGSQGLCGLRGLPLAPLAEVPICRHHEDPTPCRM